MTTQTTTHFVKEHVKVLLSLDRQLQSHQDSSESSASNLSQQQQQLGVWQVFQPGAEGGIRAPGGSGTAGPASVMIPSVGEATQTTNNSNNNTRKRRASARLVTLSSIIHVQGIGRLPFWIVDDGNRTIQRPNGSSFMSALTFFYVGHNDWHWWIIDEKYNWWNLNHFPIGSFNFHHEFTFPSPIYRNDCRDWR